MTKHKITNQQKRSQNEKAIKFPVITNRLDAFCDKSN